MADLKRELSRKPVINYVLIIATERMEKTIALFARSPMDGITVNTEGLMFYGDLAAIETGTSKRREQRKKLTQGGPRNESYG